MSDYPMLISNKLHSFRNFALQKYIKHIIWRIKRGKLFSETPLVPFLQHYIFVSFLNCLLPLSSIILFLWAMSSTKASLICFSPLI